ncbi:hypothetical protein N7499_000855 [Penicillium canescens]|uniref:Uncharacterized protein n=1 Tax=Penicillium canescens TaxID=5083 RepID=A0AAD6NBI5_PENCN|nr:uncharacterized protein N7446_010941 [Penicillium canescens]KAJ6007190.1 hypothetical protein N7522_005541 [Penicillium canescens]KAJ6029708.1 hypothetical protein N7444_012695 [Penicillium canescens]KAJ6048140.1 hypothetical protein N7460_004287 [Penicillium canescens]KAJ6048258.1 hypothetical protein N7446_010941 [Penicillium canescens]KAJ6101225.1 hypothetical protein N7499_000855 [Penicillium canescens]
MHSKLTCSNRHGTNGTTQCGSIGLPLRGVLVQKIASEVTVAYIVLNEGTEGKQQVAEELVGALLKRVLRNRAEGVDRGKSSWCSVYEDRSSKP